MNNFNKNIMVKAVLESGGSPDIRKFRVEKDASFAQFEEKIRSLYLMGEEKFTVKYVDSDSDRVSIKTSDDLALAVEESGDSLRVIVQVRSNSPSAKPSRSHIVHAAHANAIRANAQAGCGPNAFRSGRGFVKIHEQDSKAEDNSRRCGPKFRGGRRGRRGGFRCFVNRQGNNPNPYKARFVKDVTMEDGAIVSPGATFLKTWELRNVGDVAWPESSGLLYLSGKSDKMGAPEFVHVGAVAPGDCVNVSASLIAPTEGGRYIAYFRMAEKEGRRFGQRIWAHINVGGVSSDQPTAKEARLALTKASIELKQAQMALQEAKAMPRTGNGEKMEAVMNAKLVKLEKKANRIRAAKRWRQAKAQERREARKVHPTACPRQEEPTRVSPDVHPATAEVQPLVQLPLGEKPEKKPEALKDTRAESDVYAQHLHVLGSMGFTDANANRLLLERHSGHLPTVVNILLTQRTENN